MSEQDIEKYFPNLIDSGYSVTSPSTSEYNCIAWAAGDTEACWWPDPYHVGYWPSGVPRTETLESFIKAYEALGYAKAYEALGYALCQYNKYENGFEKIAIYVNSSGKPTHAARQLNSGCWTSKLGSLEDIEHNTLDSLIEYGKVAAIMKKPK